MHQWLPLTREGGQALQDDQETQQAILDARGEGENSCETEEEERLE